VRLRHNQRLAEPAVEPLGEVTARMIFFWLTLGSSSSMIRPASLSDDFDIFAVGCCRS
jgi:hypothetical protein